MPPTFAMRRNPLSSMWVTMKPISSMWLAVISLLPRPSPTVQIRLPSGVVRQWEKGSINRRMYPAAPSSCPETPVQADSSVRSVCISFIWLFLPYFCPPRPGFGPGPVVPV